MFFLFGGIDLCVKHIMELKPLRLRCLLHTLDRDHEEGEHDENRESLALIREDRDSNTELAGENDFDDLSWAHSVFLLVIYF